MRRRRRPKRFSGWRLLLWGVSGAGGPTAQSQNVPATAPPVPAVGRVAPAASPRPAPVTLEQLAERLRVMEETNRKLAEELARTKSEHADQMRQVLERLGQAPWQSGVRDEVDDRGDSIDSGPAAPGANVPPAGIGTPVPDYTEGQFSPHEPAPGYSLPSATDAKSRPLLGRFGPGFQFQTRDREFGLTVHLESQFEGRVWASGDQIPGNTGIFLPRQRIFFNGNITKPIEYEFSINRGFGNLNILNAYINLHFDDRIQLRFGRFFTPLPYDQYAISNYWLPTPERSIFTTNVGLNRQFGLMGWGYLFDEQLDYAAGVFNGSRNSFEPLSSHMDFVGYLNARPFQQSETLRALRFLNLGTSVAFGDQDQAAVPVSFRIAGGSPTADVPGPGTLPFLILNRDVIERGDRLLGSVHAAYYYKSLSLIGEWQYGYGGYASSARPSSSRVPFSGFYATGAYFLTGEQVERRARVIPLRPLVPTSATAERGWGAWEIAARVSELRLGNEIFTSGFADPNLWSNHALTTELGLNWYWNEYIKVYIFWLNGQFGNPVQVRPGDSRSNANMFWLRFQLYF